MADKILSLLLSLTVTGGLMALFVYLVCLVFPKRTGRQWQYYIWIVVMIRFLLPFAPEIKIPVMQAVMENVQKNEIQKESNGSSAEALGKQIKDKSRILEIIINRKGYLCVFWLMTAALFLIRKVTIYQNFIKFIRAGSIPVENIDRLEILSNVEKQLGIKKAVELYSSPLVASPMLAGFSRPFIVLPEGGLSEQEYYYIFLHELTHFRRKDMYYKWLVQAVICIHWFNPLAYLAGKNLNRLCELSCDEAVVFRFKTDGQCRAYGATILNAAAYSGVYKEPSASLMLSENKKLLKERLESIMNRRKNTVANRILTVVLTMAVVVAGVFSGNCKVGAVDHSPAEISVQKKAGNKESAKKDKGHKKKDVITAKQADKMALELTDRMWVWEWVEFFVPYMTEKGAKKLVSASRNAQWAGTVDMTTGKEIKFTKKQVNAARKKKPSESLTCGDIDVHALMIMESNGDWDCISFMLPYMTHKGIRAVVRCYNSKQGGEEKKAEDYY